jgi:hypothetical protein
VRHEAGAMKVCRHCERELPASEFPANRRTRDGLSSWCKACHYAATRAWRERIALAREGRRGETA